VGITIPGKIRKTSKSIPIPLKGLIFKGIFHPNGHSYKKSPSQVSNFWKITKNNNPIFGNLLGAFPNPGSSLKKFFLN